MIAILSNTKYCKISFVWSAVPVIKCFKMTNFNILNILHVHRGRFWTVLVDTRVPETVPKCYTKRGCCKKCHPSWCDLNETLLQWSFFFLSARSRTVSSQLCLHETIDYSVSNCLMIDFNNWIGCLTSQLTIFQSYMWRHIDVQADWRSCAYGRAPTP